MRLNDSVLTSQGIDGMHHTFSACILCFDVARRSCYWLILLSQLSWRSERCFWCHRVQHWLGIPKRTSLLIQGKCVLCTIGRSSHFGCPSVLPMKHSLLFPPLNLVSLLTRLWLDDIFNLFVQRSLAYWGKRKKRKMTWKKDEPSSKHICVRPCTICCSNLWEHLCLWHEGAFITLILSPWQ